MADISQIQLLNGATYNIRDEIARAAIPTVSSSDNGKILKVVSGSWAAANGILVVHATLDMEHAESEEAIPLILDKTMAEMLAAEYTVLAVDVGEGAAYYEFTEIVRLGSGGDGEIRWYAKLEASVEYYASAASDGEELVAYLEPYEEGGGSTLIATAEADYATVFGGTTATVTLDKTYNDLYDADLSVVKLSITSSGEPTGTVIVCQLAAVDGGDLVYSGIFDGYLVNVTVDSNSASASAAQLAIS